MKILVALALSLGLSTLAHAETGMPDTYLMGFEQQAFNPKKVKNPKYSRHYARHHHERSERVAKAPKQTHEKVAGLIAGAANDVVSYARTQIGNGAVYGRSSLWCARFMNTVLERTGHKGTGSDMASSFASKPRTTMHVGAIAVMSRGRHGGHVGIVSGIDGNGNPIIISGNHGHRVAEATYSRNRIYAYVMP